MTSFYDRALPDGHSGYFSEPTPGLDPNLFDGMHLKPAVRHWLVATLDEGLLRYLDLSGAHDWLNAWLAGSGITYQWSGDRGLTGDLDVLFGVDMVEFVRHNPDYQGIPEASVADHTDQVLRRKLWPTTAHTRFGQGDYEVTFYWNPGTGTDISRIHPYAAYDLKRDVWVVRPPSLPSADPHALYPGEWFDAADRDIIAATKLAKSHANLTARLASTVPNTPGYASAHARLVGVQDTASALFDEIHGGRREAFGEQGHGYSDFTNFRWQRAKEQGVVAALQSIRSAKQSREAEADTALYGGHIDAADQIVARDILRYGRGQ